MSEAAGAQPNRLPDDDSGLIDTDRTIRFSFNDTILTGYPGDTLASAFLASGQRLIGRSFKYHRPRGIFSAGSEEPNALVELRRGAALEPNTRATQIELFDGLEARSQNFRGSVGFDLMAVNDFLSPLLTAGFYYKTFMWPPKFWEKYYEPAIRASAGLGRMSGEADPDVYDKGFLHCDLLIVGAGPAGLIAALTAGRNSARVILCDEDFRMGGRLSTETDTFGDLSGSDWAAQTLKELASLPNVRLMTRTTVYGAYDHGTYGAVQRMTDHLADSSGKPRQVLWRIYSKRAILCTGATERSIAFGNNDRPGVMLAGAVRAYVNRWRVTPGHKVTVFTNNDNGWRTAHDLAARGVGIPAVIDSRPQSTVGADVAVDGARTFFDSAVVDTRGRRGIRSLTLASGESIETDCLAVSGGWSPNLQLSCHQRGRPLWDDAINAFVPGEPLPAGQSVAGAANGQLGLRDVLSGAAATAERALEDIGLNTKPAELPAVTGQSSGTSAYCYIKGCRARAFVDLQNDVTSKDIVQSHQEGYRAVEHLKRYTTLGMATDQGKTANLLGLAVLADCSNRTIAEAGTTIYRPPYTAVTLGALGGRARGKDYRPTRLTPSHQWASEQGAVFVETGMWLRAQWFPRSGETQWRQSVDREVTQTRRSVGVCDVTTLGKIDVQGRDAATFLNRIYANGFAKLPVGRVRYGLMLREDGIAMDDGTAARLGETHFLVTTTTANAGGVFRHLEFCRQCLWPNLDVALISATEQYAQYSVAGPNARSVLQKIVDPAHDISNLALPFMACAEVTVCGGVAARLFRISFSGELAYELALPSRYGDAMIRALMQAGEAFDIVPYGTEALGVMRIEKGHAAGNELNGQTTARDLGMGRLVAANKDSIGSVLSRRAGLNHEDGLCLMGFVPVDPQATFSAGAHFIGNDRGSGLDNDEGWMSSVAFSPTLGHTIGLGFIKRGADRIGETVRAVDPLRDRETAVSIVSPHFVDPEGERLRG